MEVSAATNRHSGTSFPYLLQIPVYTEPDNFAVGASKAGMPTMGHAKSLLHDKTLCYYKTRKLTQIGRHPLQILGLPLPGPALLPGRRRRPVEERLDDGGGFDGHRRRRQLRMVVRVRVELGAGERRRIVQGRGVDARRRLRQRHLEVEAAEDGAVPHPEVVALGEGRVADGAGEALHVEDELARPHHQLGGEDGRLAPCAPLHPEEAVTRNTVLI